MPAVLFRDHDPPLYPGLCDVDECDRPARYSLGNLYFCGKCLIDKLESGAIPDGVVLYRVEESVFSNAAALL
jgi:hypothetical protein